MHQPAQPRLGANHFSRNQHQEGSGGAAANTGKNDRRRSRQNHLEENSRLISAKGAGTLDIQRVNIADADAGGKKHRPDCRPEYNRDFGGFADAEKQDKDREQRKSVNLAEQAE